MANKINSIAVLGSGTMGAGIAALAADKDCKVLLLDIDESSVNKAKMNIVNEKRPLATKIIGNEQISGCILQPHYFVIIDLNK